MLPAQRLGFEPKIVVDFMSATQPRLAAARGSLLLASIGLLKESAQDQTVLGRLSPEHRDALVYALAASWVPVEAVSAFYQALDAELSGDVELSDLGERLGVKIAETLFASMLRTVRSAGGDGAVWLAVEQSERMWTRVYQGGGLTMIQTGPKDVVCEVHGLPFAQSRAFQMVHLAFLRGLTLTVARVCVAKPVRARQPRADRFACSLSWV